MNKFNIFELLEKILPYRLFTYAQQKKDHLHYMIYPKVFMPNFLVVGGVKCGTFSLYKYLKDHPNVLTSGKKEIGYFNNDNIYPNHNYYLNNFRSKYAVDYSKIKAVGEFTPSYSFQPCISRIYDFNKNMRLIHVIRNPVDRAISQYYMYKKKGMESRPIEKAIFNSDESNPHQSYAYLTRGVYVDQIREMYKYFPKSQVLILKFEEFFSNKENIRNVYNFLNIPYHDISFETYNKGDYDHEITDKQLVKDLYAYYDKYNLQLRNEFNIDVSDWLKS